MFKKIAAVVLFPLAIVILLISISICHAGERKLESIDKSAWKKYINKEEGFEFRYPPQFTISKDSGGYTIVNGPDDDPQLSLSFSPLWKRDKESTLGQFIHNDTSYGKDVELGMYDNESATTMNDVTVHLFHQIFGSHDEQHFFFLKDENSGVSASYTICYFRYDGIGYDPNDKERFPDSAEKCVNFEREYKEIISTFHFTKSR